jgi:hypothetical protein
MSKQADELATSILNRLAVLNYALISAIDDLALHDNVEMLRKISRIIAQNEELLHNALRKL